MMVPHTAAVDGVQWAAHHLTAGLVSRNHTVDVLYNVEGSNHDAWREVTRRRVKLQSPGVFPRNPVTSLRTLSSVVRASRRARWDVIYANRIDMVNTAAAAALASRAPMVMYLHNEPPPWFSMEKLAVPGVRAIDWVLSPSRYIRQRWEAAGMNGARMSIIPYGVDPERFGPVDEATRRAARASRGIDADAIVVAFVGRIERVKGVHLLVEAFTEYAETEPAARLILVGGTGESIGAKGNEYVDGLRRQTDERTIWWGVSTDVASVLALSDVLVIPSLWAEPSAVSAVEGLATGIPVLVSRSGGMPEHFEEGLEDLVFDQGSSAAILDKLRRYGDWRASRPELGPRIRAHALDRRSLAKSVMQTERLLRQVCAEPRRRTMPSALRDE